jgi:signal-transduction protein with cAMP-binding, CBS, and nucleotidyltransferase domain
MRSQSLRIKDVAVHQPVTARTSESIGTCARRMHDEHVGCLVVVEHSDGAEFPIGMLTDRDIAIEVVAFGLDPATLTAGDVMSEQPAVVEEDDDLLDALAHMRERGVRRLPVVRPDGALTGMLALDNLLEAVGEEIDGVVGVMRAQRTRELRLRP